LLLISVRSFASSFVHNLIIIIHHGVLVVFSSFRQKEEKVFVVAGPLTKKASRGPA
jgi:hypothetical protein